jgi:geranylgeranyl reductase family protein
MPERRDVLVVGGGPAGAATATLLRQRGRDVLLLDEARFPRDKVCGESVSPMAWPVLEQMGVAEAVRAQMPQPIRGMTLTSASGASFAGEYRNRCGFALRREALDATLLEGARRAGVEIREGARVEGLVRDADHVTGVTCDGEPIGARLVVGADGRRSVVARALGLLGEHRTLRKFAVRGHWEGVEGLGETGEMHVVPRAYCGVAPLTRTSSNVAFVVDQREMADAGGDLEAFYRRTLKRWPRLSERLERARLLAPPKAIGPLALRSSGVSRPGALLVGDAAGFYDPFTGEGVTLALRSAELAAETAHAALDESRCGDLSSYDRARQAATRHKFRFNRLLQTVIAWPSLGDAVARRLARRKDLADRLVGVAGDFVPAETVLGIGFVYDLLCS